MDKTKSLSVHRNTVERRNRKAIRDDMIHAAKAIGRSDIVAYSIVAIDSHGNAKAAWDTGGVCPLWSFAGVVSGILSTDIKESGVEDDWHPSLSELRKPAKKSAK